jgi:phage head maturation protease
VVIPTGLRNLDEYLVNPVVLWAHNRAAVPPIGICRWVDVQPRRVVAETKFAQGVPFAEDVFKLYEQGVLRGWSIGFVPRKARRVPPTVAGKLPALRVEEWDLLEYSAVPIPENPGALTVALQKGLIQDPVLKDWLGGVPDDRGGKVWRAWPADVLADLIERTDHVHSE